MVQSELCIPCRSARPRLHRIRRWGAGATGPTRGWSLLGEARCRAHSIYERWRQFLCIAPGHTGQHARMFRRTSELRGCALEALLHQRVRCLTSPLPVCETRYFPGLGSPPGCCLTSDRPPVTRGPDPASGFTGAVASNDTAPGCVCTGARRFDAEASRSSWGFCRQRAVRPAGRSQHLVGHTGFPGVVFSCACTVPTLPRRSNPLFQRKH